MSDQVEFLDLDDLLVIAEALFGGAQQIRDIGLLEAALARPRASAFGEEAYPTIHQKAAALMESLVKNHALVDGNKRLGYTAVRYFYELNGYAFVGAEDAKVELTLDVAAGRVSGVGVLADRLEQFARAT